MIDNNLTARAFLAREIRRAREAKGMSRAALCKGLFVSESLVAAWESCRVVPRPEHLNRLIGLLDFGPDIVVRILENLVAGEVTTEWTGKWLAIETEAHTLLSFEVSVVPGLLQTEAYARAVLRHNRYSPIDVEERINDRMQRQEKILDRDYPPTTVFLIDEKALRRPVGGPEVMIDQLKHLVAMSERSDVLIQIVPVAEGDYAGLVGPFMIAKLSGADFAYRDGAPRGQVLETPGDVAALSRIWQSIHAAALSEKASVELIEGVTTHGFNAMEKVIAQQP